jgi:hypothetical protein
MNDGCFYMTYVTGLRWIKIHGRYMDVYQITTAVSNDGIHWERTGNAIVPTVAGPNECQASATVFRDSGQYRMIFCYRDANKLGERRGYKLGHAVSADLVSWSRNDEDEYAKVQVDDWNLGMQCYPNVFEVDGTMYLLHCGNKYGEGGIGLSVWSS